MYGKTNTVKKKKKRDIVAVSKGFLGGANGKEST